LWTALLTLPLMTAVQEICDRTALATGTGLGELAVRHFHRAGRVILAVLLGALIVANGLNIAADLVAIGSGMQLLHAGPTWLWALVAGTLITALLVLGSFARIALAFQAAVRSAFVLISSWQSSSPMSGAVSSATRSSPISS
jgi:Mn2+/Fe2+ NRAMP family transporter